ncbi:uncharacterized protein LOC129613141 [Condylostylus longicornis]|uniref:uncharacterized protein LOC129613141 n=1 Tax=Condylostylus longicornis TaxID=2530218 RepID=UPI00244E1E7C|nr:uncharacterized protein LOC129613141 [Condylostylus longicornis]
MRIIFFSTYFRKLKIDSKEDNVIEVELIGSPTCDITENTVEILDYHEEFLEEEENLFNLLPCKTESSFRKFEEAVRTDSNFQEKLKELYFTKYNTLELTDDREDFSDDSKISIHSGKAYDFKPFIEYNIRKIASDEVISIFPSFANEKLYKNEYLNCSDISVLKILQECTQQKFACLSTTFIKNQINLFVNKTKENLKNWNIIKKTEECRMKLQSIKPRDIITPDSHSIHLQSIFNLPLNNFESLQDFNLKCLNNEEMSLNLMTMFLQASEYDCNKFVDKNLRKLITENLGGRLTWNGIQENIAMKDFYIMKLLIDATKKHFPQQNEEAIIESIKLALRRFKDRVRKRKISISSIENIDKDNKIYLDASAQKEEEIDNDITQLKRIPCRTIKEFQDFEIFCRKCKNLQTNLKRLFDSNPNVEDIVKFISENLKKIVIDSVLSNFTYNGLKNNIGVKYYTIIRILLDSLIVKNPYISEEEAIKALKKALLLAKDRQRSMYKKRKKN